MREHLSSPWAMGLVTLIGFPILAWGIMLLFGNSFLDMFSLPSNTLYALPLFLSAGIIYGLYVMWIGGFSYFDDILLEYKAVIESFKITGLQGIFISISAGVGEEILYRGALQPIFGIWITSIIFVGSHYILFKEKLTKQKVLPFTIMIAHLLGFSVAIGYIAQEFSLWHAMAIHFSYDLVQLMYLHKTQ